LACLFSFGLILSILRGTMAYFFTSYNLDSLWQKLYFSFLWFPMLFINLSTSVTISFSKLQT
jgi:hypothetical protein